MPSLSLLHYGEERGGGGVWKGRRVEGEGCGKWWMEEGYGKCWMGEGCGG